MRKMFKRVLRFSFVFTFAFLLFMSKKGYSAFYLLSSCTNITAPGMYALTTDIWNASSTCINISSADVYFTCQGHTIDGNKTASTYGILVDGTSSVLTNITITNCTIQEFDRGIYVQGNPNYDNLYNIAIENTTLTRNAGDGMRAEYAIFTIFRNLTFSYNGGYAAYFDRINNGSFSHIFSYSNYLGVYFDEVESSYISDIVSSYNSGTGIYFYWCYYSSISSLISFANSGYGIYFVSNDMTLYNISVYDNGFMGIYLSGKRNNISSFTIRNNMDNGFYIGDSYFSYNNITNGRIEDNVGYGIKIYVGSYNRLEDITVSDNRGGGVYIESGPYNKLKNMKIIRNAGQGIGLWYADYSLLEDIEIEGSSSNGLYVSYSDYNTINNITVRGSGYYGVVVSNSYYNVLSNSRIENNSMGGMYISYNSANNTIYNNFFNNTQNILTWLIKENMWNTSLREGVNIIDRPFIGGNAYATPNGTGFSETCQDANHDGICDNPYNITAGNIDYHPLAFSATYPLNPRLYVEDVLVWEHKGFFNSPAEVDITDVVLSLLSSKCSSLPCNITLKYFSDSRGGLNVLSIIEAYILSFFSEYVVKVKSSLFEKTAITNITIYDKNFKNNCSTFLENPVVMFPGEMRLFKIPCNISCSDIGEIIVDTVCGVKDKLSSHSNRNRLLFC